MRKFWLIITPFFITVIISCLDLSGHGSIKSTARVTDTTELVAKAKDAQTFCREKGLNPEFCFLLDMSRHSGLNRFYIWQFSTGTIMKSGLVSHGCCSNIWGSDMSRTTPNFSNEANSHCSSLGKYKIGSRGVSQWGIKVNYRLHGLEKTNSNSDSRRVVLHSWEKIGDRQTYPNGTPEGWGCPAVSNAFMTELDSILKTSKAPSLLWIYK